MKEKRGAVSFYYGAMGAAKTAMALIRKYNFEERGMKVLLLKPSIDTREDEEIVKSRVGLSAPSESVESLLQHNAVSMRERLADVDCIIVDEAQFLTHTQVVSLAEIADNEEIAVYCYGLRTDFQGKLFEGSAALMASADTISEIETTCWCGYKATHNARFNEFGIVLTGKQVEIGGNDRYIALCRKHFHDGNIGTKPEPNRGHVGTDKLVIPEYDCSAKADTQKGNV